MIQQKPIFKNKEIVVEFPREDNDFNLGGSGGYKTAEILYVGEQQEQYKVGDKIVYRWDNGFTDKNKLFMIDFPPFGKKLLKFDDGRFYVVCKIEE